MTLCQNQQDKQANKYKPKYFLDSVLNTIFEILEI